MIKLWWKKMTAREQTFIAVGGAFAILFLVYSELWSPWQLARESLHQRVLEKKQVVSVMRQAQKYFSTPVSLHGTLSGELLPTVERALSNAGLDHYVRGVKQKNKQQLELVFRAVPFDALRTFLKNLWKRHGVYTRDILIDRAEINGTVQVKLTLRPI